ncbi:MAG: ParB/RepB/Spo0J family partition protein [Clostridia bacterium]|nr:ParB/RepB/Spo0J family partition protein [Clostridia bacterium]
MHTIKNKKLLMLRPREIRLPLYRVRKSEDEYALSSLAESIKKSGIIEPLAVRKNEKGKYVIITGERRLKAAIMANLRRVPCVLHDVDTSTALVYSIVENLQRANATFFEEAEAIKTVMNKYRIPQYEMAARLGISQNVLLERLRLLRLNEGLRARITEASLSESHARILLRLPPEKREDALEKIIAENMTSMKTEIFVNELLNPKPSLQEKPKSQPISYKKSAIGDIRLFSNSLSKLIETLKNSGIDAYIRRIENDRYIEYKVRIKKDEPPRDLAEQLKIV